MTDLERACQREAEAILAADGLLIGAGAGMGVDSGLPDFRGPERFWRAYPAFRGRRFEEMSNPVWFQRDPAQAWGFFGHRLNLYRATAPHAGFSPDRILECHGSIHFLQCVAGCTDSIWPADDTTVSLDASTIRARPPLPQCIRCGRLARPNVLMFNDWGWVSNRSDEQQRRYRAWLSQLADRRLAAIEFGAGTAVPTVRWECERRGDPLIRVNPRDSEAPPGTIVLPMGALQAIQRMDSIVGGA
jgi:NAD-dependent SIR2 family protein deacetylase